MKKRIKQNNGKIKLGAVVTDFLPAPSELVLFEPKEKVTLELSTSSLDFFKQKAAALKVPYQRMIRNLLDQYVARVRG